MAEGCGVDYTCAECCVSFKSQYALERHKKTRSHCLFVLALKQPVVSKLSLHPDFAVDTDDGINQHADTDCESPMDNEETPEEDSDAADEFQAWMNEIADQSNELEDYSPFPSKIFALLYFLVHGPHPVGTSTLMFIWFMLKKCGVEAPSLYSVKSFALPGLQLPIRHESSKGVPFYCQTVASTVKLCMANPKIASSLARYPVQSGGTYEEIFHGCVWNSDERFQAPMAALHDDTHIFVRDCIIFEHDQLSTTKAVIVKFFQKKDAPGIYAEIELLLNCHQFQYITGNYDCSFPEEYCMIYGRQTIPISCIVCATIPPLLLIKWTEEGIQRFNNEETVQYFAPNQWKEKSGGRRVVIVPLILFTDDTSGNRSKKWNKFDSWYLLLAGLGRHANAKPTNIHFLTTSNKVSALEMSQPIMAELSWLESDGFQVYDAFSNSCVLVIAPLLCVICDNPRARELCNQLGNSTRKYCRICMADKVDSPDTVGVLRTKQLALSHIEEISAQTSISKKVKMRKKFGLKETPNPILNPSLKADIYKGTPLEALHIFLLGASKYFLEIFMPLFTATQKAEIMARISAFNMSGFTVKMLGNVCYYYQSFVGRDFKAWSQFAIFILGPYLNEGQNEVLLNYSKVFAIAYSYFYNEHLKEEWKTVCQTFISSVKSHYPELLKRPKMHLILHLVDCMAQYGPTSAYSAESCESFNGDVRTQNIYSNRLAPSRDIGKHFAVLQYARHIIDGGQYDGERCGESLRRLCLTKHMQAYLCQTSIKELSAKDGIYQPGTPRMCEHSRYLSIEEVTITILEFGSCTVSSLAQKAPPFTICCSHLNISDQVREYRAIVAQSLQLVHIGEYIEMDLTCEFRYAVMLKVCKALSGAVICIVQPFEPLSSGEESLLSETDCPLYELSRCITTVEGHNILRTVSFVHQCNSGCHFEERLTVVPLEREKVEMNKLIFVHDFSQHFYCFNQYCILASIH